MYPLIITVSNHQRPVRVFVSQIVSIEPIMQDGYKSRISTTSGDNILANEPPAELVKMIDDEWQRIMQL